MSGRGCEQAGVWRAVRRGQGGSRELAGVTTIVWGTRGIPELGVAVGLESSGRIPALF